MKLLLTQTAYPPAVGGMQLLLHQLAREFSPRHTVQAVTQWDTQRTDWLLGTTLNAPAPARSYIVDGVPVRRITLDGPTRWRLMPWVLTYYAVQGPALKRIAAALETAIEHELCQVDLVHNGRIGREGLSFASLQLARRRGVPFVLTPVHHPRWGSWLHRYYHRLYREADAVIALTETERQTLVQLGVREGRVFVTGMGPILADAHDGARFRAEFALGDEPLILYLGQKYAYKGLEALLAAAALVWKCHPETRFAFLGPRTVYSQRLFSTVRDDRILELDTVSLQTKTDALAACQVLCVPSTQESFGGVYTEAWSLGKPVVAADIPAVRSVVTDGQDGLLVSQAPGAIADALVSLLGKPGLAQQMGISGRGKVVQRYTWPCLAQQTERVYDHVLRQGR